MQELAGKVGRESEWGAWEKTCCLDASGIASFLPSGWHHSEALNLPRGTRFRGIGDRWVLWTLVGPGIDNGHIVTVEE